MPKFIFITNKSNNRNIRLNVKHIAAYEEFSGGGTFVFMNGRLDNVCVIETPDQIDNALLGLGCNVAIVKDEDQGCYESVKPLDSLETI